MIPSQTSWAKLVVFLAIPLLIILIFRNTKILFLNQYSGIYLSKSIAAQGVDNEK